MKQIAQNVFCTVCLIFGCSDNTGIMSIKTNPHVIHRFVTPDAKCNVLEKYRGVKDVAHFAITIHNLYRAGKGELLRHLFHFADNITC